MKRFARLLIVAASLVGSAAAQPAHERVLLPVVFWRPTNGAYGAMWNTRVTLANVSDTTVLVRGLVPCNFDPCNPPGVPPHATFPVTPPMPLNGTGRFLFVEAGRTADIRVQLRAFDSSRASLSWGADVPVVRESEGLLGPMHFLSVPNDASFRVQLRLYAFDTDSAHPAVVRIYASGELFKPDRLVAETTAVLEATFDSDLPAYTQVDLTPLMREAADDEYRVEVIPARNGVRYWGLVSVTNNTTQQITLVPPR